MEPQVIALPKICDPRGNLTFAEEEKHVPFKIARVYWTYDVPAGQWRGGHSHHVSEELIIATSGSFNVNLHDGRDNRLTFTLNRPFEGLYVPPGWWRTLDNFSSGSVCMVMTSTPYSEEDYIRDYDEFIASKR